jgi:uridine kinase
MTANAEAQQVIEEIARRIEERHTGTPLLTAVDGVDTAGKTTFADRLAEALTRRSQLRPLRCTVDGFHNSRELRYRRGADSPEGFFYDCFDYPRLREQVIEPVRRGGGRVRPGDADVRDGDGSAREAGSYALCPASVLILDGIFLHRDELYREWDLSIYLEVSFDTVCARATERDAELFGSPEAALQRYRRRYIPGQELYLRRCRPRRRADILIDNNDPRRPVLLAP